MKKSKEKQLKEYVKNILLRVHRAGQAQDKGAILLPAINEFMKLFAEEKQRVVEKTINEFLDYLFIYQKMINANPQQYDPDEWNTIETIKERFEEIFDNLKSQTKEEV